MTEHPLERQQVEELQVVRPRKRMPNRNEASSRRVIEERLGDRCGRKPTVTGCVEMNALMDDNAGAGTRVKGAADLDDVWLLIDEPPPPGCRRVAEDRTLAYVQQRSRHAPLDRDRCVTEREHASMADVEG